MVDAGDEFAEGWGALPQDQVIVVPDLSSREPGLPNNRTKTWRENTRTMQEVGGLRERTANSLSSTNMLSVEATRRAMHDTWRTDEREDGGARVGGGRREGGGREGGGRMK
jgi:hypothetical protein